MSYRDDFKEIEDKMIDLARTMRGAQGKDKSLFVLAACVRRTRRLLAALEHERDYAVTDFLDGWPGTEEGYNSLDRAFIWRPHDYDRFEEVEHYERMEGYEGVQYNPKRGKRLEIIPFKDRDVNSTTYSNALRHAKDIVEKAYQEADEDSSAVKYSYGANQTVTEDQLLTYYQRGREHQDEVVQAAERQAHWNRVQAERAAKEKEGRVPEEGWSIFDWTTGERVGPATVEQVAAFKDTLEASDEPVLVSTKDPAEVTHVGWRRTLLRVKQGRKWGYEQSGPMYHSDVERPVRVGRNELQP